jgi:hypothetical protein
VRSFLSGIPSPFSEECAAIFIRNPATYRRFAHISGQKCLGSTCMDQPIFPKIIILCFGISKAQGRVLFLFRRPLLAFPLPQSSCSPCCSSCCLGPLALRRSYWQR